MSGCGRVLFAILSFFSGCGRRYKCQPRWISSICTHAALHVPHAVLTAQFNFLHPIPSHLSGATSLSAEGTLTLPPPPSSSLSRHCCCEDEMSVLLKVPLRHNSELWCLTVLFQSQERGWERVFMAWSYFRAVTTDRIHREVPLTASAPIQIENSEALTNNTSQMMNNVQWHPEVTGKKPSTIILSTGTMWYILVTVRSFQRIFSPLLAIF